MAGRLRRGLQSEGGHKICDWRGNNAQFPQIGRPRGHIVLLHQFDLIERQSLPGQCLGQDRHGFPNRKRDGREIPSKRERAGYGLDQFPVGIDVRTAKFVSRQRRRSLGKQRHRLRDVADKDRFQTCAALAEERLLTILTEACVTWLTHNSRQPRYKYQR